MKLLADTIVQYVVRASAADGTFRFVLPSYPPRLLLSIGRELEERLCRQTGRRTSFVYGVAHRLGEEWKCSSNAEDRADFESLCQRGWYSAGDNLTGLRNRVRDPRREDTLVCVLAGYQHIDDRASLQDFFHLDDSHVWEICLRRSFQEWVVAAFRTVLDPTADASAVGHIRDVLTTVYERGLADLLGISTYLEGLDLSGVSTPTEAYALVLRNLAPFGLPPMPGLARTHRRRRLADYIGPAKDFGSYALFLEEQARRKALDTLRDFAENRPPEPEPELLGRFRSLDELLAALRRYIEGRSQEDLRRLLAADFTYIHDAILGYRPRKTSVHKPPVRKVRGVPPEVFLRALWLTLGDYCADAAERSVLPEEDLRSITLRSLRFTHDFVGGDEDSSEEEGDRERAHAFLRRVLGGVDNLLEQAIHLGEHGDSEAIPLRSLLCPSDENTVLGYQRRTTVEPKLRFEVVLETGDRPFRREFEWCLPQNHPSRLLDELYAWALDEFRHGSNALPAYAIPYLPEVFQARDEEEVLRILGEALRQPDRKAIDLLAAPGMPESSDPALSPLRKLSGAFQGFLKEFHDNGLFAALDASYDELRLAYRKACEVMLMRPQTELRPMLLKAFFLVDDKTACQPQWEWRNHLGCAIATPLHPAVLDMMRHQHTYLCDSFVVCASERLKEPGGRRFTEGAWNRVTDLARIERPIFGILRDAARLLESRVRSYRYVHLIGQAPRPPAQLGAQHLLEAPDEDDEDVTDTELFRETRTSALVCQTLNDYRDLHPHANDGLAVGAYCGGEIQPIIAGIDAFLDRALGSGASRPYGLKLTIFCAGRDDSSVMRWLDAWRERWQEAELTPGKRHYEGCQISVAYRVVPDEPDHRSLARLLRETSLDVLFLLDFCDSATSRFEDSDPRGLPEKGFRYFPVLEKACCPRPGGAGLAQRERVLSHRRFALASLYAEVMARVARGSLPAGTRHVLISESDLSQWVPVIDAAHEGSAWVVCLDATVDDDFLREAASPDRRREIIGFATGVGSLGEKNYTVSTEQFALADIRRRIASQLSDRLGPWNRDVSEKIAQSLVDEASHMAGLSVVKATGRSEYVRDYIAYATLRKLLRPDPRAFCDEIVSLDAFRHWFDDGEAAMRPDLLRLRAYIVDGYLDIRVQVFECKLAQSSERYLREAYQQVAAGLTRLVGCFRPLQQGERRGIDDRPDQQYWWMQLHRLVASSGRIDSMQRYGEALDALERLAEGLFSISWQGAVLALWTDVDRDSLQQESEWPLQVEGEELAIPVFTSGARLVQQVCLGGMTRELLEGLPAIRRSFRTTEASSGRDAAAGSGESAEEDSSTGESTTLATGSGEGPSPIGGEGMSGMQGGMTEQVLLGHSSPGERPVYWEFGHPDLPNRHMLIFGASGTGKTYTIQALLCEFGKAGQNSLIVDYTEGFKTDQLEAVFRERLKPRQHVVRKEPLPINPFRRQHDVIEDTSLEESPSITAQRVAGVFSEVYQLGDQQKSMLYTTILKGLREDAASFNLEALAVRLEEASEAGGPQVSVAASLLSKIRPFIDMHPFGEEDPESWEKLYTDPEARCHILQLTGFSRDMARLVTEFSLIDLYRYYRTQGSKDRPRVVVLDEIQNLDHSRDGPLSQLLTEGRKFGISLILATQTLSGLDKEVRDRLFQASHKLFFRPAETELKPFAQVLADATDERAEEWVRRLSLLPKGECYSLGPARDQASGALVMRRYSRIRVQPLSERF